LPSEQVCIENMIILTESRSTHYPILIDPQGQAIKFLRQLFTNLDLKDSITLSDLKITQNKATEILQRALQGGHTVIIENAGEVTDASLLSILRKDIGAHSTIKFNDNMIDFDSAFFCYICC
jgi:hypothetical protein